MTSKVKKNILRLKESSTLAINEKSKELIEKGKKIYRFGFGQSPFPVPVKVVDELKNYAAEKSYLPVEGLYDLREVVAHYYCSKGEISVSPDNVLIGPGSKELMFIL